MAILSSEKAIRSLRKTPVLLYALMYGVDQEKARTLRDGADGWNTLEVVGHMLDLETSFWDRIRLAVAEVNPHYEKLPYLEWVTTHKYSEQDLQQVLQAFYDKRRDFITYLESLTPEQWARLGTHPEYGEGTVLDQAVSVALHDINHIEQLVRILEYGEAII